MIREILRMGDPRLLSIAKPVDHFDTPELHALIADMFDTMHAANGAGLAAPQIGVDLQVVISVSSKTSAIPRRRPCRKRCLSTRLFTRFRTTWKRAGKAAFRCRACVGQ